MSKNFLPIYNKKARLATGFFEDGLPFSSLKIPVIQPKTDLTKFFIIYVCLYTHKYLSNVAGLWYRPEILLQASSPSVSVSYLVVPSRQALG